MTTNATYRFFAQQIPSIPDGAELRMQRFLPMTLDPDFFGNVLPPDAEPGEVAQKGIDGKWDAVAPGPGVGNDTRASDSRSDTPVFTVASRAWTSAYHSTGWTLPEAGTYEIVITTAGNRAEPVRFSVKDVRERNAEVNTADTSQSGISYLEVDGIRFGRTAANTLLIATESNFTGSIAGYSFGYNATYEEVPLEPITYSRLTSSVSLPTGLTDNTWGAYTEIWRYTATAAARIEVLGVVEFDPDFGTTGGGERAGAQMRVRHMNSSDVEQRVLNPEEMIYVRNNFQGGSAIFTATASLNFDVAADLAIGDYILVEGQGAAQVVGAGRNIVVTTAGTLFTVKRPRAVAGIGITDNQVVEIVKREREYEHWVGTNAQLTALSTYPAKTVWLVRN